MVPSHRMAGVCQSRGSSVRGSGKAVGFRVRAFSGYSGLGLLGEGQPSGSAT